MNVSANQTAATPTTKAPEAAQPAVAKAKAPASASLRQFGDAFARLLLAKAVLPKVGEEAETLPGLAGPDTMGVAFGLVPPLFAAQAEVEAPAPKLEVEPGGVMPAPADPKPAAQPATTAPSVPVAEPQQISAPQAVIQAALKGDPLPAVPAIAEPEALWEATVNEPHGVTIQVRATQAALPAAGQTQPAWNLTIVSPALESAVLAQHAPRLAERLRLRAIENAELHFEDEESEAD